ncbi:Phosphonate ABC transporter phosphate-binding periplasmic component (TC 3.A.1.9.1) [hydrothermal vent metagenome]|uniref:Phosphonate ABC transporter phosphate-binding periplasmic component (TC 3.A.1.9.1) n=1 Tax=hydrothermal vent metagenome TaxID=652676 RepID=A0A3B0X516_9ZZZZ
MTKIRVVMPKQIVSILLIVNLSSCSSLGVEPWERDELSKKEMQFGSHGLNGTMDRHFYYSKEASSGGEGFSGGGCGCN